MVDMGMGDEHVRNFGDKACGQSVQRAKVKKDGPFFPKEPDIDAGILEWAVDRPMQKCWFYNFLV